MSRIRLAPLLLVVATFLAVGCKPTDRKMAAALPTAPPIFQVIPAGTNPNTLKIPGAQGTVLQNSGGVGSWVMDSTGTWVTNPPTGSSTTDGGVACSVADGGGLSGNCTVTSPLFVPDAGIKNAQLATMAANTVKGSIAGGAVADLSATQVTAFLNPATTSLQGAFGATDKTKLNAFDTGAIATVSGSAVTTFAGVTGLTGDSDGGYEIEGMIVLPGTSSEFYVYINGADPDTSPVSFGGFSTGAALNNTTIQAHLYLSSMIAAEAGNVTFRCRLGSKSGILQAYNAQTLQSRTNRGDGLAYFISGMFQTSVQITSIGIHATVANQIGVGSYIRVRKLGFGE